MFFVIFILKPYLKFNFLIIANATAPQTFSLGLVGIDFSLKISISKPWLFFISTVISSQGFSRQNPKTSNPQETLATDEGTLMVILLIFFLF